MDNIYTTQCPTQDCGAQLVFSSAFSQATCTACGSRLDVKPLVAGAKRLDRSKMSMLQLLQMTLELAKKKLAYDRLIQNQDDISIMRDSLTDALDQSDETTCADLTVVDGYSDFHCKLIAPYVTEYGIDATGVYKRSLKGSDPYFDFAKVAKFSFCIEEENLGEIGYGRDQTGAAGYLSSTLEAFRRSNAGKDCLAVLHADGDGHCLVHAISKCIAGREFFWHALRVRLHEHLNLQRDGYLALLSEFVPTDDWDLIVKEATPDYTPPHGDVLGLSKVHIFALAQVLYRPIILLDNLKGVLSSGDYASIYLPVLRPPDQCRDVKTGQFHQPLIIAWSSNSHSHFVPVVPIVGAGDICLKRADLPELWLRAHITREMELSYGLFDEKDEIRISPKLYPKEQKQKLVDVMTSVFDKDHRISAGLVEMMYKDICSQSGSFLQVKEILQSATDAFDSGHIMRCISCGRLSLIQPDFTQQDLCPGGWMYETIRRQFGRLVGGPYSFTRKLPGKLFKYNEKLDCLELDYAKPEDYFAGKLGNGESMYEEVKLKTGLAPDLKFTCPLYPEFEIEYDPDADCLKATRTTGVDSSQDMPECHHCFKRWLRKVDRCGYPSYIHEDRTLVPSTSLCCGRKHFCDLGDGGKLYDYLPETVPLQLSHRGKTVSAKIQWVQGESDASLNSSPYIEADKLVAKHFADDFSTEDLRKDIVEKLFRTAERLDTIRKKAFGVAPTTKYVDAYASIDTSVPLPSKFSHSKKAVTPATKSTATAITTTTAATCAPTTDDKPAAAHSCTVVTSSNPVAFPLQDSFPETNPLINTKKPAQAFRIAVSYPKGTLKVDVTSDLDVEGLFAMVSSKAGIPRNHLKIRRVQEVKGALLPSESLEGPLSSLVQDVLTDRERLVAEDITPPSPPTSSRHTPPPAFAQSLLAAKTPSTTMASLLARESSTSDHDRAIYRPRAMNDDEFMKTLKSDQRHLMKYMEFLQKPHLTPADLRAGGILYDLAKLKHGVLVDGCELFHLASGVLYRYNKFMDRFEAGPTVGYHRE